MTSIFTKIIFFIVLYSLITNCSSFGEGPISKFLPKHNSWFQSITKGKDSIKSAVSSKIPKVPVIDSTENNHLQNFLVNYVRQPVAKVVYPVYDTVTRNLLPRKDTIESHVTKPVENLAESFTTAVKPNWMNQFHKLVPSWLSKEKLALPFKNLYPSSWLSKEKTLLNTSMPKLPLANKGIISHITQKLKHFQFLGFPKNFLGQLSWNPLNTVQKMVGHLMPSNLMTNITSKIAQPLQFFQFKSPLAGYSMNFFNQIGFNPLKKIKQMLGYLVPSSLVMWVIDKVHNLAFFTCGVVAVVLAMLLYRCMNNGEYEMFEDVYSDQNNEDTTQDKAGGQLQDSENSPSDIDENDDDDKKDVIEEKETPVDIETSSTQTTIKDEKEISTQTIIKDVKATSTQTITKDERASSTHISETTSRSSESQTDLKESKDQELQTHIPQEAKRLSSSSSTRNFKIHPPAITPNI